MKIVITFIVLALASTTASAQYRLTVSKEEYRPLEDAIELVSRWYDTVEPVTYVDLGGETFKFFDEPYTFDAAFPLGIAKNGHIKILKSNSGVIIDPYFTAMIDSVTGSKVLWKVEGETGNKVLKIEWRIVGFFGFGDTITTNFQSWHYQNSGKMEFRYGPHTIPKDPNDDFPDGAYVGLFKGTTDFMTLHKIFHLWGTNPEKPSITKLSFKIFTYPPDNGTVYSIVPPSASVTEENGEESIGSIIFSDNLSIPEASSLTLYDMTGRELANGRSNVDVSQVTAGMYMLRIKTAGGVQIRKALKQ